MASEPPRVVFVGCTGSGKSSLCTAMTGQDKSNEDREASTFKIGKGAKSETTECTVRERGNLRPLFPDEFAKKCSREMCAHLYETVVEDL